MWRTRPKSLQRWTARIGILASLLVAGCLEFNDAPPPPPVGADAAAVLPPPDAAPPPSDTPAQPPPPPPAPPDARPADTATAPEVASPPAPACMANSKRCGAAGVETCRSDGSGWDVVACPAGCAPNGTACATCKAGTDRCTPGGPQEVCNEDGSGWMPRPCPSAPNGNVACDPDGGCGITCNAGYARCGGKPATCAPARWSFASGIEGFAATGDGVTGVTVGDVMNARALIVNIRVEPFMNTLIQVSVRLCTGGVVATGRRASANVLLRGAAVSEFDRPSLTFSADLGGGNRVEAPMIFADAPTWQRVVLEGTPGALWYDLRFALQLVSAFEQPFTGSLNISDVRIE